MKRILLLSILSLAVFESTKPVPVKEPEAWIVGKELVAYYQHFTFPDGTRTQLKSKTFLDEKGWEALAKKQWTARQQAELNKPEICPHCGGTGFVP